ncbi:hypothetical protein BHM03_00030820 [Ensete ventricosum]|nr:hypothetical protein BHM03_00030820 [Ensete ventricosum]
MASGLVFPVCWFLLLSSVCGGRRLQEEESTALTLESVRKFLTREEDSIVFSLIERAKYPRNAPVYDPSYLGSATKFHNLSLVELFVRETEAVQAKDRDALMKLLTFKSQEDAVKTRVEEKAKVFGQDVTLGNRVDNSSDTTNYKVDPVVVYGLYGDWVIPMTKMVEVEYLLRRLD